MKLDIAPFAHREQTPDGRELIFRWEEVREVHRIDLDFEDDGRLPRVNEIKVHYWRNLWPHSHQPVNHSAQATGAHVGWQAQDDWFNGEWTQADVRARARGQTFTIGFAPLARREFPELSDYNVRFRSTIQLRLSLPEGSARIKDSRIFTDTSMQTRNLAIQTGCGKPEGEGWPGEIEVYNGILQSARSPAPDDPRAHLEVVCAKASPLSNDRTIITLRSPAFGVSFRPDDLNDGKPIWIPDYGVLVTEKSWNLRYSAELVERLFRGKCIYDRIASEPEQTLQGAMRGQLPKDAMHFIVGCEGGRQKFGVLPNGDVFACVGYIRAVPASDTPRLGWENAVRALHFEWNDWLPNGRRIMRGYLPLLEQGFCRESLDIKQEVFASPLDQSILAGPIRGDATIVCLSRITFTNHGPGPCIVSQPFHVLGHDDPTSVYRNFSASACEQLQVRGDEIWTVSPREHFRLLVDIAGEGELVQAGDTVSYHLELAPGASHSIVLKLPFICQLTAGEINRLRSKHFEAERVEVTRYWESRLAKVAELITPDQDINDFTRSHLTHILINDDFEVGSDRIFGRVSSFHYGNFANETIMQVLELDRRGYHDEARRHLDIFLHYQGTAWLQGVFQSKEGLFFGSGGYECGDSYTQHHGWVLWGLAEHYRFTGDREWLLAASDRLVAGCDWVIREREATKRADNSGRKTLEYGFLPAGGLEDVGDFYYWLSTNCLTARGLRAAAEVLAEVGHSQGERLLGEAKAYEEDLRVGFTESMIRSPVVPLRDGSYLPHFPSRLYLRGRDFGWIREVLEGAIWLTTTVLEPNSRESTWILKDFEDNRYLDAPYNYKLENFEREWFCRGGFSFQPNLLYSPPPYLPRDQIEHFLRAFFNGFAACWRRDIRAMAEHEMPTLSEWAGDHFKTSDESMVAMWLRMMFIQEDGRDLYLGRGLPRAWVGSKAGVAIRKAATYFGPMSFDLRISDDRQRIAASIAPPTRKPPERIFVRFRHPEKARLVSAFVDGQRVDSIDPEKEWVVLPGLHRPVTVEAHFAEVRTDAMARR